MNTTRIGLLMVALTATLPMHAAVVVPNAWAGTEAPSAFGMFASGVGQKLLQVNASSEFGATPLLLTSVALRPDVNLCPGNPCGAFSTTLHNLSVTLATTSHAPDDTGSDNVFGDYLTTNVVTVFSGDLTVSSSYTGPASGPKNFDILFPFTVPYLYNPASGNLVVQFAINGTDGLPVQMDAAQTTGDPVARIFGSFAQANGIGDSFGFVMQFQSQQQQSGAPEPGTASLLLCGIAAAGGYLRRRGRRVIC